MAGRRSGHVAGTSGSSQHHAHRVGSRGPSCTGRPHPLPRLPAGSPQGRRCPPSPRCLCAQGEGSQHSPRRGVTGGNRPSAAPWNEHSLVYPGLCHQGSAEDSRRTVPNPPENATFVVDQRGGGIQQDIFRAAFPFAAIQSRLAAQAGGDVLQVEAGKEAARSA